MKQIVPLLLLLLVSMNLKAENGKWRKIKNKLYSLELPAEWKPQNGMPGDGYEPGRREAAPYIIHYFAWSKPFKSKDDAPTLIGIDIQTYEKQDGSVMSMDEARKRTILSWDRIEKTLHSSSDELRCTAIGTSKEMDGSMVNYRRFYLLKKKGNRVHCISLSLREKFYKESPDMQNLISHILDSFKVN